MSAQPQYITRSEFDSALSAFSGHVDHVLNMTKAELRREIIGSEDRLVAKIDDIKRELQTRIQVLETKIDSIEAKIDSIIMLDQLSKINKKLGVD
jgi:hypothetical protein